MVRFFTELSYRGTNYHGWQSQPNAVSVQTTLDKALTTIIQKETKTTGAGRTDTGVHARFFVAHFDIDAPIFEQDENFIYRVNAILPSDIVIHKVYRVKPDAHARFSALSRIYTYTISQTKDPFNTEYAWYYPFGLNLELMNQAAGILLLYSDFTSFSKLHTHVKNNICQVKSAFWKKQGDKLVFTIEADRFLRNMVRAIIGTMIETGRGKITISDFKTIIEGKHRSLAGVSVPAHGLCLTGIKYPDDIR
jgi:tRNA pseudouridine38-40 synthase